MEQKPKAGKPAPDMINLAILAAGGYHDVAAEFGITHWTPREWIKTRRVPPQYIRRLCEMGGVVTPDQILAYIEASAAERAVA